MTYLLEKYDFSWKDIGYTYLKKWIRFYFHADCSQIYFKMFIIWFTYRLID